MDNLTHSLVGLMLARAAGSESATNILPATLMIAANIPDIDVVAGLGGALDLYRIPSLLHACPGCSRRSWR